jgi:TonB family protein
LNVEISEIDATQSSGTDYAFLTRTAQTQLVMDNRQTIVLAGMIKKRNSELVRRVPLLGSIPLVGALFRSKQNPAGSNTESELVISITPTILDKSQEKNNEKEKVQETPLWTQEPVEEPAAPAPNPVISKVMNVPAPVVSVPGAGPEGYALSVQQKILSAIAYPYEAQEKGWEGTVKLTLVLQRDGTLQSVLVKEPSGYELFDQDALNTAQILAPYAAFSPEIEADDMTVTIPIVYSLDGFLKNVAAQ